MSTSPTIPVKGIAVSAAALGAAIALIVPMSASAAAPVSQGEGRLLVASLLNSPTDPLAVLAGARAVDATGGGTVTTDLPLDATALQALNLKSGGINLFGTNGIVQLGAVGQWAQARDDGSSYAFAGTASDAASLLGIGGVNPTTSDVGTPAANSAAQIGIGAATDPVSINATIGALAASAQQPASGAPVPSYEIDNVSVVVGGTIVSGVTGPIDALLGPIVGTVNGLGLATPVTDPLAGGQVTISASDLLTAAGVTDLNHLTPGTDLLQFLPAAVVAKVTALTNSLLTDLNTAVTTLGPLGVTAAAALATATPLVTGLLGGVSAAINGPLGTALTQLAQLTVNNQTTNADGSFTENALTVGVGPAGSLARVAIANATVGPNGGPVTTPPGTPGTPGTTAGGTPAALLAETGVTIPVGATLAGAGLLAAAGIGLTRLAAWRRRGTHRSAPTTR